MAKTDADLATEAAQRADAAVNAPRDPRATRSSIKSAASAARAAIPQGAGRLNEPVIADAGTGIVPQPGAGRHEGERAPGTPAGPTEVPVTIADDDEYDEIQRQLAAGGEAPPREGQPPEPVPEQEPEPAPAAAPGAEPPAEGQGAEEWPVVAIPARNAGQPPIEAEVEDPELAADIQRLARGFIRRETLHRAMAQVEAQKEDLAQFEDALRVDPVNLIMEKAHPTTKVDMALALLSDPAVFNKVIETFGGLEEPEQIKAVALKIENQRLSRRSETLAELDRRSQIRTQGREIDQAIQRIIPDDLDEPTATALYKDLRRDVTDYIIENKLRRLPIEQVPDVVAGRLALYGLSADEAAERLQDTTIPPLPVAARGVGRQAPPRNGRPAPARTGERVVAQADARRRAGAVPGGGAGVPAQSGWVLPKKQGVKGRIAAIREMLGGGK